MPKYSRRDAWDWGEIEWSYREVHPELCGPDASSHSEEPLVSLASSVGLQVSRNLCLLLVACTGSQLLAEVVADSGNLVGTHSIGALVRPNLATNSNRDLSLPVN